MFSSEYMPLYDTLFPIMLEGLLKQKMYKIFSGIKVGEIQNEPTFMN